MSAKTWLKEFYPIPASTIAESNDVKAIVQHSINKWTGLLQENLDRHEVRFFNGELYDGDSIEVFLSIDGTTCGLCIKYIYKTDPFKTSCDACPLNKMLGHACDEGDDDPNYDEIYYEALSDPQIMIDALSRLL